MPRARSSAAKNNSTANLGFESRDRGIWLAADSRNAVETAEGNRSSNIDAAFGNDSGTARVARGAQDNFRTALREAQNPKQGRPTCRVGEDKDDDVRWQWSEATWTGSPEGEHNSAHQYGVPPRGNANFAWVQHLILHSCLRFFLKSKAVRALTISDNLAPTLLPRSAITANL